MIDKEVLIEKIRKRIEKRRLLALHFPERVSSSISVICELRGLIKFINKQTKENE